MVKRITTVLSSLNGFVLMLCLLAGFLFPFDKIKAQSYPVHEYTVLDGLPQSQATIELQDSRGYLWIKTRNGISRFDGIEFISYFRKDGLPTNIIQKIFEDKNGYIWALSSRGLSGYDGLRFHYYECPDSVLGESVINSCTPGLNDTIFLKIFSGNDNRSRIIYFCGSTFNKYSERYSALDTVNPAAICYNVKDECLYLIGSNGDALKWSCPDLSIIPGHKFSGITADRGKIIFNEYDKKFEIIDGKWSEVVFNNKEGRAEAEISEKGENEYIRFFDGEFMTDLTLSFNLTDLVIDNESNLWFSTERNLYRLISTAFYEFVEGKELIKDIWALAEDRDGKIWMGSLFGDLQVYDGKKFTMRNDYKRLFNGHAAFYKGSIRASDGIVYFSLGSGVMIWDGNHLSKLSSIPPGTQVCTIYEDPADKSIFFGTDRGLFHLKDNIMTCNTELTSAHLGVIEGVLRISENNYCLSGEKGLLFMNGKDLIPVRDSILPDGYTFMLVKDRKDGIWVTSEEGLFFKGKNSSRFTRGLPEKVSSPANSILEMDSNHIMVGRSTDICVLDINKFYGHDSDYFKIYDISNGFTGSDCLDNGIIKDKKGKFWILTSDRIVVMDPSRIKPNIYPPRNYVTGIDFMSDSSTWEPLEIPGLFYGQNSRIELTRENKSIRIKYTGISMTNPGKVKYRYRLLGRDEAWSEPVTYREALYENLSPGNYTFQLKSCNSDGIESDGVCSLSFRLIPAFWQTLFFKILSGSLIIALIALLMLIVARRFERRKAREARMRSELSRLQMNSIIGQFDSHFTFNVLSSVGSLIMKGEKESAYDYILKLSGLLRSSLGDGSVMIRSVSEELDFVKKYCDLQKLRYKERFECSLDLDSKVDVTRNIPRMTIQTFVENSIRHGIENRKTGGKISIKLEEVNGCLEITVKDNGIGRAAAMENQTGGSGLGIKTISNIFEFLNRMNRNKTEIKINDLTDMKGRPAGTEVIIIIPDDYIYSFPDRDLL